MNSNQAEPQGRLERAEPTEAHPSRQVRRALERKRSKVILQHMNEQVFKRNGRRNLP